MNKERIAALLASGLLPAQVATIVGCSPGRISQIQQEEDFILLLSSKTAEAEEQDMEEVAISAKYTATEHALLKQMTDSFQGAELRDLTGALKVIAERQENMKARTLGSRAVPVIQQNTLVSVSLPSHALPRLVIEKNSQGEVLAVGTQTLAPLPAKAVEALFTRLSLASQPREEAIETIENGGPHEPETITGSTEESGSGVVPPGSPYSSEGFLSYAIGQ